MKKYVAKIKCAKVWKPLDLKSLFTIKIDFKDVLNAKKN